jgi:hypothetical protein
MVPWKLQPARILQNMHSILASHKGEGRGPEAKTKQKNTEQVWNLQGGELLQGSDVWSEHATEFLVE